MEALSVRNLFFWSRNGHVWKRAGFGTVNIIHGEGLAGEAVWIRTPERLVAVRQS